LRKGIAEAESKKEEDGPIEDKRRLYFAQILLVKALTSFTLFSTVYYDELPKLE